MHHQPLQSKPHGFTIVEMSIVLLVIALISASVIVGRHVIDSARVKHTISQIRNYESAVNIFHLKYHGIPGDLKRPEFFHLDSVNSSRAGNGLLTSDETHDENRKFWRHLSQASLIDGGFSGDNSRYGEGAPYSELTNVGIYAAGEINLFPDRNVFVLGLDETLIDNYHIMPVDAWQIDRQMDDGLPTNGLVRAPNPSFAPFCYSVGSPDEYNLTNSTGLCALFIRTSF